MYLSNTEFLFWWWIGGAFVVAGLAADRGRSAWGAGLASLLLSPLAGYAIVAGLTNRRLGEAGGLFALHRMLLVAGVLVAAFPTLWTIYVWQSGEPLPGQGSGYGDSSFPSIADEMR